MLKKSLNYKGYILFESLISLGIMSILIGSFMSLNTFVLMKKTKSIDQLAMHRILYEEMTQYEHHEGVLQKTIWTNNKEYSLYMHKTKDKIVKVEITDGDERFILEKK
ncbi:competence type IV pilus minor pilin ComGE [Enterococcus termitis]|uniref:Type II secretion system protein n=1 Tax=Enterococcus termitis TaxID=332950 RepID=A0A1E5H656_9ENTE|nr:competence type IV pilus minor pilin ComGE [Enterococcus termitis]OEG20458.1 hypothetical protein BCR25_01160 [Enterococcus termitis]